MSENEKISQPEQKVRESVEVKEIEQIVDAVLFDWDGVLYDGMYNVGKCCLEICQSYGISGVTMEYFREHFSQPWYLFYKKVNEDFGGAIPADTPEGRQEIFEKYKVIEQSHPRTPELIYPEIIQTIQALAHKGLKLGIVSGSDAEHIQEVLRVHGLESFFEKKYIIGRAHSKVAAIKNFCGENGFDLQRVLMFGDLPSDLTDGKEAGVKVAGVARSHAEKERLLSHEPDFLFEDLGPVLLRPKPFEKSTKIKS